MFLHVSLCVCVYAFMSALLNLDSRCAKKFQFHFDGHSLYIFISNNPYTVRAPRKDWKKDFPVTFTHDMMVSSSQFDD